MNEPGSLSMMAGKNGVWGHIREVNGERSVILRGLPAAKHCTLYRLEDGGARTCAQTEEKTLEASVRGAGLLFAAADDQVVAWEEAAGAAGYFAACRALEKLHAPEKTPEPETVSSAAQEEISGAVVPEKIPVEEEEYSLRIPGSGAPVDGLPPLLWPGAAAALRAYFEACPPIRPFDTPGWRFVRAPSSVREAAYCVLGRFRQENRIAMIAYAFPGHPQRPPVPLPGYRYQMGLRGQGYWVYIEKIQ